jgi:cell division protein FtsA
VKRSELIIDIGTSKISTIAANFDEQKISINFLKSYSSFGIKKGKVVDMEALTRAIKRAVNDMETQLNIKSKKVSICYSGVDIKGTYSTGTIKVKKRIITEEEVNSTIESASAMILPQDREIIHVLPVEFVVDENSGIRDPIGMRGQRLEARVYAITASSTQIQNIINCCNKAGFDVEKVILQSIASSEAVLSYHDKDLGCLVVDIGAGTTDIAVFYDGYLRHLSNFAIAGNHITNDLAIGLKISYNEAERIKKQFGTALPEIYFFPSRKSQKENLIKFGNLNSKNNVSEIEILAPDKSVIKIPISIINEIVSARCEEIIEMIRNKLNSIPEDVQISSVILTGGISLMKGFATFAESLLSLPVRVVKPDTGLVELFSELGWDDSLIYENNILSEHFTPEFSSLIGALIYKIREEIYGAQTSEGEKFYKKFKRWISSLINL